MLVAVRMAFGAVIAPAMIRAPAGMSVPFGAVVTPRLLTMVMVLSGALVKLPPEAIRENATLPGV
ncbi:hypothetical protein CHKEEEPN_1505 [Methylorubrum podarium]|nr:hypothetical protein CHKEEEPN_1505 [Methylorubrum podarium]